MELLEDLAEPSEKTFDDTLWENQDRGKPSLKSFEEIAKEHEEFVGEIFGERIPLEKVLYRVEGYVLGDCLEPSNNEERVRFLKALRLYRLLGIIHTRQEIASTEGAINPFTAHRLGAYRADLQSIEYDLEVFDQKQEWVHRLVSSRFRSLGHSSMNVRIEEIKREADSSWASGDKRNRPKMVKDLSAKHGVSPRRLKAELYSIARKYGKLYDPTESRGPRREKSAPQHRPERVTEKAQLFRIDGVCNTCGLTQIVCTPETVARGFSSRCECGGIRSFNIYWPDEAVDMNVRYDETVLAAQEYRELYE